jgi:hypothetical protein
MTGSAGCDKHGETQMTNSSTPQALVKRLITCVLALSADQRISLLALTFSVLAFSVSVRGCQVAENTFAQSKIQFQQERSLILSATFEHVASRDWTGITVAPIDPSFRLLRGTAYFPSRVFKDEIEIQQNGEWRTMGSFGYALSTFIENSIPPEKDEVKVGRVNVPTLIQSYYATKGTTYGDVSLYMLSLDAYIYSDPPKLKMTFVALTFIERLPANEPPDRKALDEIFSRRDGIDVKIDTP